MAWYNDVFDFLGGTRDEMSGKTGADQRAAARALWGTLEEAAPSEDDLVGGPMAHLPPLQGHEAQADREYRDAQRRALGQLQAAANPDYMTPEAEARRQELMGAMGQRDNAQMGALMAQQEARGMGGATTQAMGAMAQQQQQADASADMYDTMQQQAQRRALAALQGQRSMAEQGREQTFGEDWRRRGSHDDYRMRYAGMRDEYRRERGQAAQQAYKNRERQAAGATNQYSRDADASEQRKKAMWEAGLKALG